MTFKTITLIGIMCAVLASVGIWLAKPQIVYAPHGLFLPEKTYQNYHGTPTATVFLLTRFPADYRVLGTINVEQHYNGNHPQAVLKQALDFAKTLAATHGATAIVVTQAYFDQPKGPEKGLGGLHFSGTAINVSQADF